MHDDFDQDECQVTDLSTPGWRITEANVHAKTKELDEELAGCDESTTTVVFQLMDNSSFWVVKKDGSRVLPEKGGNRKYHVPGRLDIAGKEDAKRMVSAVVPLLRAAGNCMKIFITPLPRFLPTPCCNNPNHCTNHKEKNYASWMGERLADLRHHTRELLHLKGIKRIKVVQGVHLLADDGNTAPYLRAEALWGDDPVHLTDRGYKEMADGVTALRKTITQQESENDSRSKTMPPPPKRQRRDLAAERPAWVRGNVGEATRTDIYEKPPLHGNQQQRGSHYRPPGRFHGAHHTGHYGGPNNDRGRRGGRGNNSGWQGESGFRGRGGMGGSQSYGGGGSFRGGYK